MSKIGKGGNMAFIEVVDVSKDYLVNKREKGIINNIKSLFHQEYTVKRAVKNINFQVEKGESVGYIGMNGAGKSTTIKMLSGILTPTAGEIRVGNLVPYEKRQENARRMGVVFGQRTGLNWDLPMTDTFEMYQKMYDIEKSRFQQNLKFYIELLGMEEFVNRPVRQLSLGEKMRANLVAALLHNPAVVYLDEPTVGLDVVAKSRIREFITEINRQDGVTVMLTSHDMQDIEQVCKRIIFIHQGEIFFDGSIEDFRESYGSSYKIKVRTPDTIAMRHPHIHLEGKEEDQYIFSCDKREVKVGEAFSLLMSQENKIFGIQVEEASMEDIVKTIIEGD